MVVVMVRVGKVRVRVPERNMTMPMRVFHSGNDLRIVLMFVVRVVAVDMLVFVLERFMRVFMHVALGQMQPHSRRHENRGGDQLWRDRISQQQRE